MATVRRETADVIALTLVDPDGRALPAWEPGAHLDVLVPGVGPRQYSLCGDPADRSSYRLGVLREPHGRGGSRYLHDRLSAGQTISVRAPRNHFGLDEAPHHLFIAGGIGVTPILPMLAQVRRRGGSWDMVYGGRSLAAMAFVGELPDGVTLVPQDRCGHIDVAAAVRDLPAGGLVYCCGPAALIEAVRGRCADRTDPDTMRYELFAAPADTAPAADDERPFQVELARTGATVLVRPGETILQRAVDAGADTGFDCQDGICGSCETPILAGRADHRDHVLTEQEKAEHTCMMICVSRAATDKLVLDL